eukprot:Gregarina_sp_Poly_1__5121@NODE_270_length_10308_cov_216_811151_g235_i0_p7_GENE_NODE_270_length_10308_cov_216_811151_g235_i0NODE_270_length_10308_cov_216_811151_g235_i0_p7_ORF_typecomplete_len110_score3_01Clat_adaptor_s/PF01217_20/3_8e20Methyltransf_32/PF13679_6/0_13_NODE_270_length_10308_cov_216_811151_g235_i070857414
MIEFILMVNKQGQTRLAHYYGKYLTIEERGVLESGLIRKCLRRSEDACSSLNYNGYRIVYRRYASLYFIVGCCMDDKEVRKDAHVLSITGLHLIFCIRMNWLSSSLFTV